MGLESVIVCLDVSEFMRNGDYQPTRLDAQYDAASMACGMKLQDNPETTVGVLTYGGNGVRLLTSPTEDQSKVLACLHGLKPSGSADFLIGLKTAMLALKHRKNKHGGQRVMLFLGSPLEADEKQLKALGAQLKKNNVAIDVVCIGENDRNGPLIEALVSAANKDNNSHALIVPTGALASELLTPVLFGENAAPGVSAGSGGGGASAASSFAEYGGIDPTLDPEMAMAIRMSLQEAQRAGAGAAEGTAAGLSAGAGGAPSVPVGFTDLDEDELMAQALAMSLEGTDLGTSSNNTPTQQPAASAAVTSPIPSTPAAASGMDVEPDSSIPASFLTPPQPSSSSAAAPPAPGGASITSTPVGASASTTGAAGGEFADPAFVASFLEGLEGVDVNDPAIQAMLREMGGQAPPPKDEGKKD